MRVGDRVKLLRCTDPHTKLTEGDLGTVTYVDSTHTVHVKWDNGSYLGLVPGQDSFVKVGAELGHGAEHLRQYREGREEG
jgi:Domain of unknown function (DUF4314)